MNVRPSHLADQGIFDFLGLTLGAASADHENPTHLRIPD
jgi:hypothetical protein